MLSISQTNHAQIASYCTEYLKALTHPLDGMWEDAILAQAKHWVIHANDVVIGYCSVDNEGALLAFQAFEHERNGEAFRFCLRTLDLNRAYVSTAEPSFLGLCLDHHKSLKINALMYSDSDTDQPLPSFADNLEYRLVNMDDYAAAIEFGLRAIGDERDWLEPYYAERITKKELFGLWTKDQMIGAGELRISPSQFNIADVGMVVAPECRKRGLATLILQRLRYDGRNRGLRLICSTEGDNLAAQKAIMRAGFYASHRILDIALNRL